MIDYDIANGRSAQTVIPPGYLGLSSSESHMTDDYIMGIDFYRLPRNTDSVAGRRLPGYCDIGRPNIDRAFKLNNTRYIKYNGTCSTRFQRLSERTRTTVFQTRYHVYFTSASAGRISTPAFGPRNSRNFSLGQMSRHGSIRKIRSSSVGLFQDYCEYLFLPAAVWPAFYFLRCGHGPGFPVLRNGWILCLCGLA